MSSTLIQDQQPAHKLMNLPYWLIAVVLAIAIPLVTNLLLPTVGIGFFAQRIGPTTIPMLLVLVMGGLLYLAYLKFALRNPLPLAIYSAVFIRLLFFVSEQLEHLGKHLPSRAIHIVFLIVPCLLLLIQNFGYLNRKYRYFRYLCTFFVVFMLYFLFFNLNFVEPKVSLSVGTSISQGKLNDFFYSFVGLVFMACSFKKVETAEAKFSLFRRLNLYLVLFALVHGVVILLGYPLGVLTMVVEGFKRSAGLFSHPNELGKAQGLLLTYFIGVYYYYCGTGEAALRKDRLLLGITIVINILAFLLSMSKNSFGSFGLASIVFFGLGLFDSRLRGRILLPLVIFAVLMVGILVGYQVYTGNDLLSALSERFSDTRSLEWRYMVWGYLLSHIDGNTIWFGHGLTSSNMELYRLLFDTSRQAEGQSVFVHNAFIGFVYEMGIFGVLVFGGFLASIYMSIKHYFRTRQPLFLTVACLSIFSIVCSLTDECITDLNASLYCWLLTTLIYSMFLTSPSQQTAVTVVPGAAADESQR